MQDFIINAKQPKSLARLGANRIIIKKIELHTPEIEANSLLNLIKIETKFINDSSYSYVIHPIIYIDLYKPSPRKNATNIVVNKIIEYCKSTTAIITPWHDKFKDIEYKIYYELIDEAVQIFVTETYDGFSFGFSQESIAVIKKHFPKAAIAKSISMARGTLSDFQLIYGSFSPYLMTALTGLSENEVKYFDYLIINSSNGKIVFDSKKLK